MLESINNVITALLDTPYAYKQGNEYLYIRCPLCGDSIKHTDKCHCSIWMQDDAPLIYHCWICESSGIVDENFLHLLYISDADINNTINLYNRSTIGKNKNRLKFLTMGKSNKDVLIPDIKGSEQTTLKKLYLYKRLGIEFDNELLKKLRIVFSIKDFLYLNNLNVLKRFEKSIYYLDKDYLGFLSCTKDNINFRSIASDSKLRYIRYNLYEDVPLRERLYIIPTRMDLMADEINLHIAEGPFDILGIYFHIMNMNDENNIYAAVGGSAYKRAIRYFLRKGFISNLNLNIYSDKDKNIKFYKSLLKEYKVFLKGIRIFYNSKDGEKDWGVPKERIELKESVVLK